jgi:serine/threonine protein kinase
MASTPSATSDKGATALVDDDALPPGTRFGELEILRVLGVGGFGIVYLAQDHALEREVALKEYMPSSMAGRGKGSMVSIRSGAHTETYALGLRSFVNEARLLARFDHPSLVKVYRFWEENGTAYMVMPYLQGRTLREVRRAVSASPSETWIRSVLTPLLEALELLHREDVYHRDIAPDNILLPPGEVPVLLDFGAARRAIGDQTQTFTAILKPSYAPIEQYAEVVQLRQGPWTDLYALGAVIYFVLRGTPPPPATARAVQDESVLLLPEENPGLSPAFVSAIEWALAVRPADRPQNVAALREVLEGRAAVPLRTRGGTTVLGRTVILPVTQPPMFSPTLPIDSVGAGAESVTSEATRPMTRPPVRTDAPARTTPPARTAPQRTRPDFDQTTVMPPSPTFDAPPASLRRALWMGAGTLGVVLVASAGWLVGHRAAVPILAASTVAASQSAPGTVAVLPALLATAAASSPQALAGSGASSARVALASAAVVTPDVPRVKAKERNKLRLPASTAAATQHRAPSTTASLVPDGATTPREACGARSFLTLAVCMEEQCVRPRFKSHPQCDKVREMMERRRRGDEGG